MLINRTRVAIHYLVDDLPRGDHQYRTRPPEAIRQIIVHHSATASGSSDSFASYHVDQRGWPGIGYHYVIDDTGFIDQTNDLETISYHCSGQNTASIGICLIGNFDNTVPSFAQKEALITLIMEIHEILGREKLMKIRGHNAYSAKSCPGKQFSLAEITTELKRRFAE